MKCDKNDALPELVEKRYWKEVLNLLGEKRGNAHSVGDDSLIQEVETRNAFVAEFVLSGMTFKISEDRVKGQYKSAPNYYSSIKEIPYDEIPMGKTIMLGGTLATLKCEKCHGKGEVKCPSCDGTGWCKSCNGKGYFWSDNQNCKCSQCNGSGWCSKCGGYKKVGCTSCNGTGYYQTYKEFKASKKEETFTYYIPDAIIPMIQKMGIETTKVYNGIFLKRYRYDEEEFDDVQTLLDSLRNNVSTEIKDDFLLKIREQSDEFVKKKNTVISAKAVHAFCAKILEICYIYRGKEYSLYIAKDNPSVYCYDSFPGRGSQWLRELFKSFTNKEKKETGEPEDTYQK